MMKRTITIVIFTVIPVLSATVYGVRRQRHNSFICPVCARTWNGRSRRLTSIPRELSIPDDKEWLVRLQEALAGEMLARDQFEADQHRLTTSFPYPLVLPQEYEHIRTLEELLNAYGISRAVAVPDIRLHETDRQACAFAMVFKAEMIPRYEWLMENAEHDAARKTIEEILLRTRLHHALFQHAYHQTSRPGMNSR